MTLSRRQWLKQGSFAALGLGFSLRSIANEEGIIRSFGMEAGLINLGANENPYGISPMAREAIINTLPDANRYYFSNKSVKDFRKQLAVHLGFADENILVTPGSGNALELMARHFNKGNIIAATPTFGILPNAAKKLGTELIEIPLTYEKVHDLPKMLEAINNKTALVYICNPANPTATIVGSNELKNFCIEAAKKTIVLVDEAYIDFLEPPDNISMVELIEKNPNVLVMRTFSKIHGMAGLRVGYTIGHPSLIKTLEENYFSSTQMNISVTSYAAALASMKDEAHRKKSKEKNAAARLYTYNELMKMK